MSEKPEAEKIEYEKVTVKVPKRVMDCLRDMKKAYGCNAIEWLEYAVVDSVRADLESRDGTSFIKLWELDSVFKTVLHDCQKPLAAQFPLLFSVA